jgi:flagellar hook assembly protein FlgD
VPEDKRMVMSCGPFELAPGEADSFQIGLCFSNGVTGGLDYLKAQADTILGRTGIREVTPTHSTGIGLWASPNPFKGSLVIHYQPLAQAQTAVQIYDASGRLIKILTPGPQKSGLNSTTWDGRDELGIRVPPGVYFIRLITGEYSATKKLIRLR